MDDAANRTERPAGDPDTDSAALPPDRTPDGPAPATNQILYPESGIGSLCSGSIDSGGTTPGVVKIWPG